MRRAFSSVISFGLVKAKGGERFFIVLNRESPALIPFSWELQSSFRRGNQIKMAVRYSLTSRFPRIKAYIEACY